MALCWGETDKDKILQDHGEWQALAEGEDIEFAAKAVRDFLSMTSRRLICTDTQGLMH